MNRYEIITELSKYFSIKELVSEKVYNTYKDNAWALFRTETLHCLLIMRVGIDRAFTVNNWSYVSEGVIYDERGYRENISDIAKGKTEKDLLYTSGHVLGCAFDFKVKGMSSEDVRVWILENSELFPCKVRLENRMNGKPITWVHFDTKYYNKNPKVYLFNI